ncbi:MAG: GNAT family N-acetyltransferase [Clostridia bacterium]|nr:GNAT family N-acetyltransferase [Clostridia bacterium]
MAAIFAEGFMHDPLYCHYIPYEQERQGILFQLFRKYLTDCWEVLTVLVAPELAGAMCICPGDGEGTERVALPAHVQKVYDQINQVAAPLFYEDYLVLDLLAVKPEHRGKGIARVLAEEFRSAARRAGKPGVVEIYEPENLGFYEKLGFRLAHIQPMGETLSAYLLET